MSIFANNNVWIMKKCTCMWHHAIDILSLLYKRASCQLDTYDLQLYIKHYVQNI